MKNETLIIYNYNGVACDTKFPVRDIKKIHVCEYAGDEVVEIVDKEGGTHKYDSADIVNKPRIYHVSCDCDFWLNNKKEVQNWINDEERKLP
jgi:hypothetical protein